jgi:hypothetical protein
LPSITATHELVVPKSIPIILLIILFVIFSVYVNHNAKPINDNLTKKLACFLTFEQKNSCLLAAIMTYLLL